MPPPRQRIGDPAPRNLGHTSAPLLTDVLQLIHHPHPLILSRGIAPQPPSPRPSTPLQQPRKRRHTQVDLHPTPVTEDCTIRHRSVRSRNAGILIFGGLMEVVAERLNSRLREWAPETANEGRQRVAELIELADHGGVDLVRSKAVEQEVFDFIDEGAPSARLGVARGSRDRGEDATQRGCVTRRPRSAEGTGAVCRAHDPEPWKPIRGRPSSLAFPQPAVRNERPGPWLDTERSSRQEAGPASRTGHEGAQARAAVRPWFAGVALKSAKAVGLGTHPSDKK